MQTTQIGSKGWSITKAESFVQEIRNRFDSSLVKVKYVRAKGKLAFVHTCINIKPVAEAKPFVEKMEREFGYTGVEYEYTKNDTNSVNMEIQIKIADNGKEKVNRYK